MDFKEKLAELKKSIEEAAEAAGSNLKNQNLADIIKSGAAKLGQALNHPDLDRVEESDNESRTDADLHSGGNHIFAAGDPGEALKNEEAHRRAVFDPTAGT